METVPSLSSPAALHIPVLDPSVYEDISAETVQGTESSKRTIDILVTGEEPEPPQIITIGTTDGEDSPTTAGSGPQTTAEEGSVIELIDPRTLPSDVNISTSVGTQTDLHIDQNDTVLVVSGGGGRLILQ